MPVLSTMPALENLEDRQLLRPAADVFEGEKAILIRVDVPGATPDNTQIFWDEHQGLSLHVRRQAVVAEDRVYGDDLTGDWYRTFSLSDAVDVSNAWARVKQGVAEIHVPKKKQPAPVHVRIKQLG